MSIYFFIFIFVLFVCFYVLFLYKYFYNKKCVTFLYSSITINFLFFISDMASSNGKRKSTKPRALTDEDLQNFLEKKKQSYTTWKVIYQITSASFPKTFYFYQVWRTTMASLIIWCKKPEDMLNCHLSVTNWCKQN